MNKLFSLVFFLAISLNSAYADEWHTTPDKWNEPRIFHSDFDNNYENRVRISRAKPQKKLLEIKEKYYSPNKAYWFIVMKPDTMKPGPWSTEIMIFNERAYLVKLELINHAAQYETTIKWVNEKLLYIEIWWGRVLGTYYLFDVEKEQIIIREMVNDGSIPFQQWQSKRKK